MTRDDISSLAHSKWNCKYHVVKCVDNNHFQIRVLLRKQKL
ncbi:hypothetical protein SAMN02910353_01117 [Ruminococcus sp. YRD2003]|nr:hypothetical protein SAMN02910353_01117 [Ruminococcus flavefaciens]